MDKTYKINEIFYSIQGEGFYTGTPAVFIRFSGCNLACPFCDTQHNAGKIMKQSEIINEVKQYPTTRVILTGGEPTLFINEDFIEALHEIGKYVAVETNGTRPVPKNVDWVTFSPKADFVKGAEPVISECSECKVVFTGENDLKKWEKIKATLYYAQPCDCGEEEKNREIVQQTVEFCKANPIWRISLQTQKVLNVR